MTARRPLLACALLALLTSACGDSGGGARAGSGDAAPGRTDAAAPGPPDASQTPDAGPAPHPDLGLAATPLVRTPGRMRIDQIRRSLEVITGGLTWTEDFGQGETRMLDALGATLGEPDYLLVTEENLEPSLIVAKFMQDAAHRVCTRWVPAELARRPEERTLIRHDGPADSLEPAQVRSALRTLLLRFFARAVPEARAADDETIGALYELFNNAASTAAEGRAAQDGWLAVCIGLMTDPEFTIY